MSDQAPAVSEERRDWIDREFDKVDQSEEFKAGRRFEMEARENCLADLAAMAKRRKLSRERQRHRATKAVRALRGLAKHYKDGVEKARADGYERGKADERASVVRCMRENAMANLDGPSGQTLMMYAAAIAAGAHEEKS